MTEKRFTITQDFEEHHRQIRDNGHIIMGCFVEPQAEVIVDVLNQLNDENEQLKQEMGDLGTAHAEEINKIENEFDEEILKLEKENEQLKKEVEDLKQALIRCAFDDK